jgi:hypothetical protein
MGNGWEHAPALGFLGEWQKQFFLTYRQGPYGKVFLEWKIFKRAAYENFKLKDGIDMEVQANLGFVKYDWHILGNPTTLKD